MRVDTAITESTTVSVGEDIVSCALADGSALLDLDSGTYFTLNGVGTRIWGLIAEPRRVGEVRDVILAEYDVDPDRCTVDVINLFERLADAGLVRIFSGTPPQISGLERVG